MCTSSWFDWWSRLLALADGGGAGLSRRAFLADMDGIGPGAIFTSYARWPSLTAALLDHGYHRDEVAKILGGNAQRVFRQVQVASKPS